MDLDTLLDRIVSKPGTLGGKPCIRDTRVPVSTILSLLTQGATVDELLQDYPHVTAEDIRACIAYAYVKSFGRRRAAAELQPS
jgi:uncharacterized protein (DUF433 family)